MLKLTPFIKKLKTILNEPKSKNLIVWNQETFTLTIHKPEELSIKILPFYFKHCNFSSFVRQLNLYGFNKIDPDFWIFRNKNLTTDLYSEFPDLFRRKKKSHDKTCFHDINFLKNQINETRNLSQRMFIVLSKILDLLSDNYNSITGLVKLVKTLSKEIFILNKVIKDTFFKRNLF
jgi:heat shock transcription factor|mmetsp:Transcript_87759/g.142079  ORF Transcript_87759/g.142079 Transcript_87759/m.142079 type:complete len:176 (+) Transcript_87759:71-598(+)